jgi:hypothetical protein
MNQSLISPLEEVRIDTYTNQQDINGFKKRPTTADGLLFIHDMLLQVNAQVNARINALPRGLSVTLSPGSIQSLENEIRKELLMKMKVDLSEKEDILINQGLDLLQAEKIQTPEYLDIVIKLEETRMRLSAIMLMSNN